MNTAAIKFSLEFPKNRGELLIFSLPQTNHYQNIFKINLIPPRKWKTVKDKQWGNKILVLTLNDVKKKSMINFQINPKSFKISINKNYKLSDYQKIKIFPNRFISGQDNKIRQIAKKIIGKEQNLAKIIKKLYNFTLNYLYYGRPITGLYSYKQAMEERVTDCGGFSTFLASLLQSLNIPCRLVVGFIIKKDILKKFLSMLHVSCYMFHHLTIHAWLEVLLPDNSWFPLDPSIDWRRRKGLSKRQGGFGIIPADRLVTSFGCDFNIKVNNKNFTIDLLQKPIYVNFISNQYHQH